eukprot:TRINITY_DN124948_c0_g1_i1.p1 TRINITY_DN124948_c0_g1~~TRINITY_DN124948_c0_g1_i1.p1  ORF type:complete len:292 (+),score=39.97 TRINITY_DN124948_c0_g1_i1:70-876(+)
MGARVSTVQPTLQRAVSSRLQADKIRSLSASDVLQKKCTEARKAENVASALARIWREADAVCFDVDSTVIMEEGIDKLAERAGKGEEVARLTRSAMGGTVPFGVSLERRLGCIKPTAEFVKSVAMEEAPLTPGIAELVTKLHNQGKKVFLVSGGFRVMINPIATRLGIPLEHVYANQILFDEEGRYATYCQREPTSESGGKAKAIDQIMRTHGLSKVVMVGDGATDMEAKPPAGLTVGFGGNVVRETVKAMADLHVYDFAILTDLLPN